MEEEAEEREEEKDDEEWKKEEEDREEAEEVGIRKILDISKFNLREKFQFEFMVCELRRAPPRVKKRAREGKKRFYFFIVDR